MSEFLVLGKTVVSPEALEHATVLSLSAIVALAFGIALGAGAPRRGNSDMARQVILRRNDSVFFGMYAVSAALATAVGAVAWIQPGLAQPLVALAGFKWAFYWLLAYHSFVSGGTLRYFALAFAIEFVASIGGFFADFRAVFVMTACAFIAAGMRLTRGALAAVAVLVVVVIFLATLWTAIKGPYRAFVSGGQATQVVSVGFPERAAKIAELVSEIDAVAMTEAAATLAERFAYVEVFAAVIEVVPALIPHEAGALWIDALTRPFMPRLLFPDKAALNDSQQVNKYSGLQVSGIEEATSISIGYVGETYIDFGSYGVVPAIFLWGVVIGLVYRWISYGSATRGPLGMGLACAALFPISALETSLPKAVGLLATTSLAAVVVSRLLVPRLCGWLQVKPDRRT
ncbi:MAG: hypothetical protein EKK41_10645 [Hyphomicrobiales bacterium]|nr:MAG: hypothetical protein EKK41_10645 [Hyphomicrobiales bacterium]